MIRLPIDRIDMSMIVAFAGATGVDRIARATTPASSPAEAGIRFVDQAIVTFRWSGAEAYLTPIDSIALVSGTIILVRFIAWALSPLIDKIAGKRRRGK